MTSADADAAASSFWANRYQLLGVGRHATTEDIEAAYRAAMARLPTSPMARLRRVLRGSSAGDLRRARDTLIDPQQRREYDEGLDAADRFPFMPL